jgi:peptide/nickel transport system ATP-binding protein
MSYAGEELTPGIRRRSKDALRGVQYIFQNPYASLNPRRTIGGLLAQPLEHFTKLGRRERDQRVLQAVRSVSLPYELLDRYPDQLSGGERQRVAIARALVVQPRMLICDEVTSALDVSVQAAVIEMLRRLQEEQSLSMLFITHNLALVRSIAQQVVVMSLGRIVESGPVEAVLDNPQAEYTQRLLEDVPKFSDVGSGTAGF